MQIDLARRCYLSGKNAVNHAGSCVLYWMTSVRRLQDNFALVRAHEWAQSLGKELIIVEGLSANFSPHAERTASIIMSGSVDRASSTNLNYLLLFEKSPAQYRQLFLSLIRESCVIITDAPLSGSPNRYLNSLITLSPVLVESIDSSRLHISSPDEKLYTFAHQFRKQLHRRFSDNWISANRLRDKSRQILLINQGTTQVTDLSWLKNLRFRRAELCRDLESAHLASVELASNSRSPSTVIDRDTSLRHLEDFLETRLHRYDSDRNQIINSANSKLSVALHFGFLSIFEIIELVLSEEHWSPQQLRTDQAGKKENFWGLSSSSENFLDECLTWRELAHDTAMKESLNYPHQFERYESIPTWSRKVLQEHAADLRPMVATKLQLESAETNDQFWNACQRCLVKEGLIPPYLRMLWAKKIIQLTKSPEEAFTIAVELNNRYSLDGRDPNSFAGISWCFGKYDRPWGPKRPIFGSVRYMSSDSAKKKFNLSSFLEKHSTWS